MMPQTVPNRPTKGPADATVARNSRFDFEPLDLARDRHVEHFVDARLETHKGRADRSDTERFHSRMAATKRLAMPLGGLRDDRVV